MTQSERDALRVAKQCIKHELKSVKHDEDWLTPFKHIAKKVSDRRKRLERALEEIDRMMK